MQSILSGGDFKAGDVVVIRYEGPRGGPGMRESARRPRLQSSVRDWAIRLRFLSRMLDFPVPPMVWWLDMWRRRLRLAAPIALVEEGDSITIDAETQVLLQLNISLGEELERRRTQWAPREPRYIRGVLAKYARLVSSSSLGAVTDVNG